MSKPIVLVTGASGQLGNELRACAGDYPELNLLFFTKDELPIHQSDRIEEIFQAVRPRYCINCAAYTAVDKAESEKETAFLINGESTGTLASVCNRFEVKFIHISTDYVFNGNATSPYKEDDEVDPVNIYGASKLEGERLALQKNPETIIIRTSWVYSSFGNNFVKTMIRLMKDRDALNVVNDQLGSPTYANDLAKLILEMIKSGKWASGIYHYSNEGVITWYEFAMAIKELTGSACNINPIPSSSYPTPAKRPAYSVFDKEKLRSVYGFTIPDWRVSLERCIRLL